MPEAKRIPLVKAEDGSERFNVKKLDIRPNTKGALGELAHTHYREGVEEAWEAPCYYVKHRVQWRDGHRVNEVLYVKDVIVPQCLANYLNHMDQERAKSEAAIHTNKGRSLELGAVG